jgi:hypothetical protein
MQFRLKSEIVALALAAAASFTHAADTGPTLRYDSRGVLDLAIRVAQLHGAPIPVSVLAAGDAAKITAASTIAEDPLLLPFSDDVYACTKPSKTCSRQNERKLIEASGGTAKRDGKRLTLIADSGATADFVDWKMAESKSADGDAAEHLYLGTLAGSGYQRVEVNYEHDAPGNLLFNPKNAKTAFVHNGADVAAPSPDGKRLVTYNTLNPPLSIRIAAFDDTGPRVELECAVGNADEKTRALFKGWHGNDIDLTLLPLGEEGNKAMPLRIAQKAGTWSVAATDAQAFAATGFVCRQP